MSCWVVPSVAAELWGCTIEAVLSAVRLGQVPTREDAGWTFIDVAPNSPKVQTPKSLRAPTPETYSVITPAEAEALSQPLDPIASDTSSDEPDYLADWRFVRQNVASTRRAPLAKAA